ncbi:NADH dehydrogenase [ubiquinone] 1 alpha subcomplex assembly factor 2-like [Homarus americanus]|uniref:NADH dehydrogenase [ubiquinone] 1 alpha subcomplex assembly factor 2-like n=1 Tax=Homarus americanus TaxID=6706 RepID=UPI001C44CBFD|nr:NADH dehydrogenase [ubiquinone] 1 alpha subcomplex assembly factor 2-like [Homarus americanus]
MSGKTRSLFGTAFKHFLNSLKPRQTARVYVGDDYHGNKYYEIPADPSRGKRHPQRWYVPPVDMRYDQEHMPAEWDAWLRNRRPEPPGESELRENLTIATMKKQNADKLEEKYIKKPDSTTKESAKPSYPVYDDYETTPGEGIKQN